MAISLKKQAEKIRAKRDKVSSQIFACATHGHMRFSECKQIASREIREQFDALDVELIQIEFSAVSAGKAYRDSFGGLIWNR